MNDIQVTWRPRQIPLCPTAVAAVGAAGRDLARRLLVREDDPLAQMTGITAGDLILLTGPEPLLPWADGAIYLGREEDAASLFLPTTLLPSVPPALLERALALRFPSLRAPFALIPAWSRVVSVHPAAPVDRDRLRAWLEGG